MLPEVPGLASLNLSGGENIICADNCEVYGLTHPDFSPEITEMINRVIPSFATCSNPLDATTSLFRDLEANKSITKALLSSKDIGVITAGMNIDMLQNATVETQISALCASIRESPVKKPIFVVPSYEAGRRADYLEKLISHGLFVTPGGEKAYKLISLYLKFAFYGQEDRTLSLALPSSKIENAAPLSEFDSKKIIDGIGIKTPAQANVRSEKELEAALSDFHYPVVLKVNSPDILHKTDSGGVILNIHNAKEAADAFRRILENCRTYSPQARINGILVQEMAPEGREFIIGVSTDSLFGPMVLVGMGGIFVEVFKDAVLYPAPLNKAEARSMLSELKAFKLLTGFRGSPPLDIDALCDTMVKVSEYAAENKDTLKELDLNPVFVYEEGRGICAVDALIVKGP